MYFSAWSMIHSELASASSLVAPQAVMPCPPRMVPMACGLASLIAAMSRPSWKPGRRHGTQSHLVAEDLRGERLAVGGGGDRDAGVRVQVVHVRGVHQPVHGGVDRGRGAALAVQAVIERGHHLVLALHARVDVLQRLQPVQAEHGEVFGPQSAQVAAGTLHPKELDVLARYRVLLGALRGGVAAGEVGVPLVRAEAVGAGNQLFNSLVAVVRSSWFRRPIRLAGRPRGPR